MDALGHLPWGPFTSSPRHLWPRSIGRAPEKKRMRSVLVVHADSALRLAIRTELKRFHVSLLSNLEGTLAALGTADAVVADSSLARRLLKCCERAGRIPELVFLCARSDSDATSALSAVSEEGHSFQSVEASCGPGEVAREVGRLLEPRQSRRVAVQRGVVARVETTGGSLDLPVHDASSGGIGLSLGLDAPVERLRPGANLASVTLLRGSCPLTAPQPAAVSYLHRPANDFQPANFIVGVKLQPPEAKASDAKVVDFSAARAVIQRALRRGEPLQLSASTGTSAKVSSSAVSVTPDGFLAVGVVEGLRAVLDGDVLELAFEFGGQRLRGLASVRGSGRRGLTLSIPLSLDEVRPRSGLRAIAPAEDAWMASWRCPLTGADEHCSVVRVDGLRVLFRVERGSSTLFVPGLQIDVTLRFGSGPVLASAARVESSPSRGQAAILLLELDESEESRLRNAAIHARFPALVDLDQVGFDSVWELMKDAHQFFPDYPFDDPKVPLALGAAQRALESAGGQLGKAFVYQDQQRVTGHASGLRVYARTWLFGHLAVLPGFHRAEHASQELSAQAVEYGESLRDVDFIRYVWRTENRWPNRLCTWLARRMNQENGTRLIFFHYLRRARGDLRCIEQPEPCLSVRPANREDLLHLESLIRRSGDIVGLVSDDLTADELELKTLGNRYASVGLERRREVWAVDGPEGIAAFGLLEVTTPGLCWPELTNSLRLFVQTSNESLAGAARTALIRHACDEAERSGRTAPVVLGGESDVSAALALGFLNLGQTAEWTFPASQVGRWDNLSQAIFERVNRRAAGRSATEEGRAA
jgi:hypothetical protein